MFTECVCYFVLFSLIPEMVRGFGVLAALLTCLGVVITIVNVAIEKEIGPSVMATLFLMAGELQYYRFIFAQKLF